jgi:hypothetical protein
MMTGVSAVVAPREDRGGLTGTAADGDDVNGFTATNNGAGKATEAFYAGGTGDWFALFSANAPADYAFRVGAQSFATAGMDLSAGTFGAGGALRLPNNVPITARNAANSADVQLVKLNASDQFIVLTTFALADGVALILGTTSGNKIGTATNQKIGFWNATPAVQPTAVADATDAGSVITQLNALLSRLRTIGIIAT